MLGNTDSKNLIKTSYSVSSTLNAIAEWNHNVFNSPRVVGSFIDNPGMMIKNLTKTYSGAVNDTLRSESRTGTDFNDLSLSFSFTNLSPYFTENCGLKISASTATYYRVSFYAKTLSSTVDKLFVHFTEYNSSSNIIENSGSSIAVNVDNVEWSFHELLISASSTNVSTLHIDFSSELIAANYQISDVTVVQIPSDEWGAAEAFKIRDTFSGFRPGDQIVDAENTTTKLSNIVYQRGQTISSKYAPGMDGVSYFAIDTIAGVYAVYDNSIDVNKITIKLLNGSVYNNTIGGYSLYILDASTNSWSKISGSTLGNFSNNGYINLYWSGSSWTTTKSVGEISSDGKSILNSTKIDGIAFKVDSISSSIGDNTIRFLEVSPKLTIDLSDYVVDFNSSKELDSNDTPLPVGIATSNNATLVLENLPRPDSGVNHFNIFSDQSSTSPLSNILKRDVKVRIKFNLLNSDGETIESDIPLFVGYIDAWNINDSVSELHLFDYAKYLQNKRSKDLLILPSPNSNNTLYNILTEIFQQNGFSDYTLSASLNNFFINNYYIDRQKTIWEAVQELLFPYQYMGYFDNNGFFNIKSYNDFVNAEPIFTFTDAGETGYLSNINTLSINKKEKISEIKIRYNTISTKISADTTDKNLQDARAELRTAPDKVWSITDPMSLGYTTLKNTISSTAKELLLNTEKWGSNGVQEWDQFSGYVVIDDEIIKYDGIEVAYSLDGQSNTVIVKSKKEYQKVQNDIFNAQKETGDKLLTLTRTGKLVNLERGQLGTKAKQHIAKSSEPINSAPGESDIANMYLYKKQKKTSDLTAVTGNNDITRSDYHGANKESVLRLESRAGDEMMMLGYKGDRTTYDTYEFIFAYPQDKITQNISKKGSLSGHNPHNENDYMGVFLGVNPTSQEGIYIEFPLKSNKVHRKTAVFLNKSAIASATCATKMDLYKQSKKTKTDIVTVPSSVKKKKKKAKKKTVKKKVKTQYWERLFNDDYVTVRVEMDNKTVKAVKVNNKKWGFKHAKKKWNGHTGINRDGGYMGLYAGKDTTINIKSIKAWDSKTLKVDVKPLIEQSADPIDFTIGTAVRGAALFDVEFTNGPAYAHKLLKPSGNYSITNTAKKEMAIAIGESSTEYSGEKFTPYRSKFFIKNTADNYVPAYDMNSEMFGVRISANILVKSEELEFSKKIQNNSQTSNVVEISSDWIQSEENAKRVALVVDKFVKVSMDTYQVEVFGNPLIEIGDAVNLYYHQSGMVSNSTYIIVGLDEKFDGGFETSVTLRKIAN